MKKPLGVVITVVGAVAVIVGVILGNREKREERDREAAGEATISAPSRVGDTGEPGVRLDAGAQTRLGIKTAALAPASVSEEVIARARVLDGTTLAVQLGESRSAEAALEAARQDYERKRTLAAQGQNASLSTVEAARVAFTHAEVTRDLARTKITAAWGPALAARDDLPALAGALLRREQALVAVELFAADALPEPPARAILERADGFTMTAEFVGPAPATENSLAGECLVYRVPGRAEHIVPGSRLMARLARNAKHRGWLVPRAAVVRHLGAGWVYLKTNDDQFVRRQIPLDVAHADGWLVPADPGGAVVVAGAQSLLSEELKSRMQMRD